MIGKMKDECAGNPRREFLGLRSQMYLYILETGDVTKKAKGIGRATVKNCIRHKDYARTLYDMTKIYLSK